MASSSSLSISIIFLILFLVHNSFSFAEVMILPLTHSLSKAQFNSTPHLLKSTSSLSAAKFLRHRGGKATPRHRHVSLPLSPGSDYTLSFSLGSNPAQSISLYMDTGSDVVWLPCSPFDCLLCDGKYDPSTVPYTSPVNVSASSTASPVTCKSPACSAVHSSLPSSDLCAIARCPLDSIELSDCASHACPPFYYAYADGSLIGRLYTDRLSIPMSSPPLVLRNFSFACAHSALGEPIGVAGFGRGVLSLPAQLSALSPQLGNQFSYCLVAHSFDAGQIRRPSPLILGKNPIGDQNNKEKQIGGAGAGEDNDDFVYTPMLNNPKHPYFYSVGLEAISVGKRRIESPASLRRIDRGGNGGLVVDSGTTFTMLPGRMYEPVAVEFDRRMSRLHKRATEIEDRTGLTPCYYLNDPTRLSAAGVPALVLHFGGNSSVALPRKNYFYEFFDGCDDKKKCKSRVGCMMVMNGGDEEEVGSSGPSGALGNYQQQGFEVVYDLEKGRVGFARRQCASLWDSLNRG